MMPNLPHHIIDDFLPGDLNRALLAHTVVLSDFLAGKVVTGQNLSVQEGLRKGQLSDDRLEPFLPMLLSQLRRAFADICPAIGLPAFAYTGVEFRLAAHGDGDFFSAHHDVLTGANREHSTSDRAITAVYYFHRLPRPFEGGDLHLHPFGAGPAQVVEPRNNRLVAFPSFLLHEVVPVTVPEPEFANSRFSITFWYTRERASPS